MRRRRYGASPLKEFIFGWAKGTSKKTKYQRWYIRKFDDVSFLIKKGYDDEGDIVAAKDAYNLYVDTSPLGWRGRNLFQGLATTEMPLDSLASKIDLTYWRVLDAVVPTNLKRTLVLLEIDGCKFVSDVRRLLAKNKEELTSLTDIRSNADLVVFDADPRAKTVPEARGYYLPDESRSGRILDGRAVAWEVKPPNTYISKETWIAAKSCPDAVGWNLPPECVGDSMISARDDNSLKLYYPNLSPEEVAKIKSFQRASKRHNKAYKEIRKRLYTPHAYLNGFKLARDEVWGDGKVTYFRQEDKWVAIADLKRRVAEGKGNHGCFNKLRESLVHQPKEGTEYYYYPIALTKVDEIPEGAVVECAKKPISKTDRTCVVLYDGNEHSIFWGDLKRC